MPKNRSRSSRSPASPKPTAPASAAPPAAGAGKGGGKSDGKGDSRGGSKGGGAVLLVVAGLLAVGGAVFFVSAFGDDTTETAAAIRYDTPDRAATAAAQDLAPEVGKPFPYFDSPEEARPFPVTLPPTSYTNETLQHAYTLAKEMPEVLVQLPCLCGCHSVSEDHGSLLDCYVDDHAAT